MQVYTFIYKDWIGPRNNVKNMILKTPEIDINMLLTSVILPWHHKRQKVKTIKIVVLKSYKATANEVTIILSSKININHFAIFQDNLINFESGNFI